MGNNVFENIKENLLKELKRFNYIYQSFYNFHLLEHDNHLYVVDDFEEFYYGGQDFDNCLEDMESSFKRIINDNELYLECEIIGRWEIVSNKLQKIMNQNNKDINI